MGLPTKENQVVSPHETGSCTMDEETIEKIEKKGKRQELI